MQPKLFKSKMVLNGDNISGLSEILKVHRNTLAEKIEGRNAQFKQDEIDFFIHRWNLTPHEVVQIFFDKEE
jgi:hypothetical protein